ncbi:hypothetical protein MED222_05795 [Vibrio sp. MED222]|nr:hypothetical protein MED222_05795 [Vibrio sp. MED222]
MHHVDEVAPCEKHQKDQQHHEYVNALSLHQVGTGLAYRSQRKEPSLHPLQREVHAVVLLVGLD